MEYTDRQLEAFEQVLDGHTLEVTSYVKPDALIIEDETQSIRVSKGEKENEMFVEATGQTNTIQTKANNRTNAIEHGLQTLRQKYSGDLKQTALSL